MSQEYYSVLGVDPDASREEIETAYRERVKDVHPDRNDSPSAEDEFIRVQTARDVLTDPQERARYDRDAGVRDPGQKRAYDGTTPSGGSSRTHERTYRTRWTDRTDRDRERRSSDTTVWRPHWLPSRAELVSELLRGIDRSTRSVSRALEAVNQTRQPTLDRQRLQSLLVTPTGIRLTATVVLILGGIIGANYLGIDPHRQPTVGLGIVLCGLLGSYVGYDLVFPTPYYEPSNRHSYNPTGKQRLWPIPLVNGVGLAFVGVALARGAPAGGLAFTGVVLAPIAIASAVSRAIQPTIPGSYPIGIDQFVRLLARFVQGLPVIVLFLAGGTTLGFDTPGMLARWELAAGTPWFDPLTLRGVYVGLLLNLCVGICTIVALCWSVYAMCTKLTAAPWTDRYTNGYQIRPGAWNVLVTGPFVVSAWMVISGIAAVRIPVGVLTILITQKGLLLALVMLPSVLTGLYILRRQLEPLFHLQ